MRVKNYQDAADQIGHCPECGCETFRVEGSNYILPTHPPQIPFWLICTQCGWESERFTYVETLPPAPEIIVEAKPLKDGE